MQLKYSNYVAFSHFHGKAVNNSGKFIQILFEPGHKSSYEYPDQHFYLRIPWKNHGFC